jgi:hypothetical protein
MKTSHNAIQALLEKYLEGQTSLEEESAITAVLFKRLRRTYRPELGMGYEMFSVYTHNEQQFKVSLEAPKTNASSGISWMRIAASLALLIVTSFGVYRLQEDYQERKMQEAYVETKKAFELISKQLQHAQKQVVYLDYIDQTAQKILK